MPSDASSTTSLTKTEATERAQLIFVSNYQVSLDLTLDGAEFHSETVVTFSRRPDVPDADTFLDVKPSQLLSAELNGAPLDVSQLRGGRLPLSGLATENELRIVARMAYSDDGEGLHRHVDPADGRTYLYAMSFLDAGPRWFACFDQPDLKATYDLSVRCPTDWLVIGNGAASQRAPGSWTLATTKPLSTYFVTLVAGPYHSVIAEHDGIRLGLHARASLAAHLDDEAEDLLRVTRASFDRYHELFGIRYPFGEYHQAFVPDFNAGAMENPGCVTLRDQYVFRSAATHGERGSRAGTVVHEMAHMWFGDLVTMRWWDDLWLNESFAEYMAQRVRSEVTEYEAWTEFGIRRKDWGFVADQSPSTHPVATKSAPDAESALANFDGISYAKGAAVLKQLAVYLGDEVFFAGLRLHFDRNAYGNADFADLIAAWTDAGAVGLPEWAEQWLRTSGLDTLTAEPGSDGVLLRRSSPDDTRRPHAITVGGYDSTGHLVLSEPVRLTADEQVFGLPAGSDLTVAIADSGDDTWAKIRYGDRWAEVGRLLPALCTPPGRPARVVVLNSIKDAVRDAELDPSAALSTLLAALVVESTDVVSGELFAFSTDQLVGQFTAPRMRPAAWAQLNAEAARLVAASAAGSDLQLVAARAWIRTTAAAGPLQQWLAGEAVPDGVAIDSELRWIVLERLATLGALSAEELAAELLADQSASAATHAARARALAPDPAAKSAAWALLTEPAGERPISAYELYATAEGFFHPAQTELTAPYLARYFSDIPATARHRRGWSLGRVARLCYPLTAASPMALELQAQALARPDLDPAIRRAMLDGGDVLGRAVRSLTRYAPSELDRGAR
ncbi:MAG: pepN [Frankiales bacterium]|nr:pepN [Frankiales bacterium]